jgi:hypothetical protein
MVYDSSAKVYDLAAIDTRCRTVLKQSISCELTADRLKQYGFPVKI